MEKKCDFEMTNAEKILLNAGHGPPSGPLQDIYRNGSKAASDVQKSNNEVVNCVNSTRTGLSVHDNSQCLMLVTRPDMGGPYVMMPHLYENVFHPGAYSATSERQTPKERDEQNWRLNHQLKTVRGDNSQIDILQAENEALRRELALKSEQVEFLKAKLCQLVEQLNCLSDSSGENCPDDRLINLAATNEMAIGSDWTERQLYDEEELMKSIQCSEISTEPYRNECNGEIVVAFDESQEIEKTKRGISAASSTSFEIVGQGLCTDPEMRLEDEEFKSLDNRCFDVDSKQVKKIEDEICFLKSDVKALEGRLDAEKSERIDTETKISKRLDELSAYVHKSARSRSAENAKVLPQVVGSQNFCSKTQDLKQVVSELTAAKWKLTEQAKELERENEELKNKIQELKSHADTVDVQELEEKLRRQSKQVINMDNQLQTEQQHRLEAEARVRELELEHRDIGDFIIQQGKDETLIALTTENSLLKHQIVTYKENFEVDRRDREKLTSERDTVKRYYEMLCNDLDNARQQLRKYDDDIASLRIDNSTMRNRLREVTEELSDLKNCKVIHPNTTHDFTQTTKPVSQPQKSSTLAGHPYEWKCRACTFDNQAQRNFCEVCGTQNDPKSSAASGDPNESNISTCKSPPDRHRNAMPPILLNLRNYGDIETD